MYKTGDTIIFGSYMQGSSETEKTPIEWEILDIGTDEVTLLSKYVLDISRGTNESSEAEDWLNGEFKNKAFTEEENLKLVSNFLLDILQNALFLNF